MTEGDGREALGARRGTRVNDFRELSVWRKAREVAALVYEITRSFPPEEIYIMVSQMRRSALSISSNIAEGFNRRGSREFHRFVSVALGSCGELRSLLRISEDQNLVPSEKARQLEKELVVEERMLGALQRSLAQRPSPSA